MYGVFSPFCIASVLYIILSVVKLQREVHFYEYPIKHHPLEIQILHVVILDFLFSNVAE